MMTEIKFPRNWQLPEFEIYQFKVKKHKYCLGIPIINEGEKFQKHLKNISKYADLIDIIIFDGGSTDGSIAKSFLRKQKVTALLVKTGPGKLSSQMRMGFAFALQQGYDGIITIDGNGKDGVEAIPKFAKKLEEGFDYIQGSRFIKGGQGINTPPERLIGMRLISGPMLSLAARFFYTDVTNGFRAYSRKYLADKKLNIFRNVFTKYEILFYLTVMANQLSYKTCEIPVTRKYPKGAKPTKIKKFSGEFDVLKQMINASIGSYNPKN